MKCTYCGDYADTMDHVIPQSSKAYRKRSYDKALVVPCCRECNSLLGDKYYLTVGTRAEYLYNALGARYRRILEESYWEPGEIAELGYNLRQMMSDTMKLKHRIEQRISHCELVSLIGPTIAEVWSDIEDEDL